MTRKIMCAVLAALIALSACAALAESAPGNRLGFELLAQMADGRENQFVSPVSLTYALSMAAAGAQGDTLAALLAALDAEDAESAAALNEALRASGLRWANAAFIRQGLTLRDGYAASLENAFDAAMFALDDAAQVNDWVSEHTDGLIDKLLDGPLSPDIMLLLVNAVAMDADWARPFKESLTYSDTFHAPAGDVQTLFMHQTLDARYAERDGAQLIRLDYEDSGLYALALLPGEEGVQAHLAALAEEGLECLALPQEKTEVVLSLPKLDVSVMNSLIEPLSALGLSGIFDSVADFSGMSEESLFISNIVQKVRVQVDEEGTRAAAATGMVAAMGAVRIGEEPVRMTVDRPFIFIIADEATGTVCFAGVVADPAA
ncbi:MAG: hypothetical protein IJ048_11685 [Clostridia bacterium]|nr:hypothetical protein [Clostridia bacterium]